MVLATSTELLGRCRAKERDHRYVGRQKKSARARQQMASDSGSVGGTVSYGIGQAWAGKSLENVDKSLVFHSDPRKICEEWNL
jgi:hypothetical protein